MRVEFYPTNPKESSWRIGEVSPIKALGYQKVIWELQIDLENLKTIFDQSCVY